MLNTWVSMIFLFTFSRPSFFRWFFHIDKQHVYQRIWRGRRQRGNLSSPGFVHTCSRQTRGSTLVVCSTNTTIRNFSRLVSGQLSNHIQAPYCCSQCLHASQLRSCWMFMLSTAVMCKEPNFPGTRNVDSPTSRNNCQR